MYFLMCFRLFETKDVFYLQQSMQLAVGSDPSCKLPMPPPKRKVKAKLNTIFEGELLDEAENFLLGLIFERPLLFDYTMPIAERNPGYLARSWSDVHAQMKNFVR